MWIFVTAGLKLCSLKSSPTKPHSRWWGPRPHWDLFHPGTSPTQWVSSRCATQTFVTPRSILNYYCLPSFPFPVYSHHSVQHYIDWTLLLSFLEAITYVSWWLQRMHQDQQNLLLQVFRAKVAPSYVFPRSKYEIRVLEFAWSAWILLQ